VGEPREVGLLERDDATWCHPIDDRAQRSHGAGVVHEHQTSDGGVEIATEIHLGVVHVAGDEPHVGVPGGRGPPLGGRQDGGVAIDADDAAVGTDHVGQQQRDVARTAADVQDRHAGSDPGLFERMAGEPTDQIGLLLQSVALVVGIAEDVGRRRWGRGRHDG